MRLDANEKVFSNYLEAATAFWRHRVLPAAAGDPTILVELFPEDLRVTLRNLTLANALRRFQPARIVVLTGWVDGWHTRVWPGFDADRVRAMATAFGANEIVDIRTLLDRAPAGDARSERPDVETDVETVVAATALRLWRAPRLEPAQAAGQDYARLRERGERWAGALSGLFAEMCPIAFITSHVDYDLWGLAVETARRCAVPVIHVQQTGNLKAYALWPEHDRGEGPFRAEITRQVGAVFQQQVWPLRAEIRRSAELVVHRSKYNLGRPSWWRSTANSWVQLDNVTQRQQVRAHVAARLGWDPELPVVTVYNHAISDALGTNREVFPDLATWFERTAEYASGRTDVNWLLLDHPSQALYDETGFFATLAGKHAHDAHLVFRPSEALSKNAIWSLTDLGVTVRGSVSNELPAYGIPVLQAGWSEWSACGLSLVATDEADYWRLLEDSLGRLCRDEPVITEEQVQRARLWMWLYRAAADVVSPLVPHWENLTTDEVLLFLSVTMRHVESDGDALFLAVRRMWRNQEPLLSGLDLTSPADVVAAVLPATSR
jgi:hypothetical protein